MPTRLETSKRKSSIAAEIRSLCLSGELAPGSIAPPVRELAAKFGLSIRAVNLEMQKLVSEGILVSIPRVGTFVRDIRTEPAASRPFALNSTIAIVAPPEGLVISWHARRGWSDYINVGAMQEINRLGFNVMALHPDRLSDDLVERLAEDKPFGVVIPDIGDTGKAACWAAILGAGNVPTTVYGNAPEFAGLDRVTSDHEQGSYILTRYLIERGRRRIMCAWPSLEGNYWYDERLKGYRRALLESSLEPLDPVIVPTGLARDGGYPDFNDFARHVAGYLVEYLRAPNAVDAFMTASDAYVFAIAEACRLVGKTPNVEVDITGYDNYWPDMVARYPNSSAPVATVDKNNVMIGAKLVEMLAGRSNGELPADPQVWTVQSELVNLTSD